MRRNGGRPCKDLLLVRRCANDVFDSIDDPLHPGNVFGIDEHRRVGKEMRMSLHEGLHDAIIRQAPVQPAAQRRQVDDPTITVAVEGVRAIFQSGTHATFFSSANIRSSNTPADRADQLRADESRHIDRPNSGKRITHGAADRDGRIRERSRRGKPVGRANPQRNAPGSVTERRRPERNEYQTRGCNDFGQPLRRTAATCGSSVKPAAARTWRSPVWRPRSSPGSGPLRTTPRVEDSVAAVCKAAAVTTGLKCAPLMGPNARSARRARRRLQGYWQAGQRPHFPPRAAPP